MHKKKETDKNITNKRNNSWRRLEKPQTVRKEFS